MSDIGHNSVAGDQLRLIIERVENVGIRCHDIHGGADHQRGRLMPTVDAGGEGEGHLQVLHVFGGDAIQCAEAGAGVILGWHGPLPVIGRRGGGRRSRSLG